MSATKCTRNIKKVPIILFIPCRSQACEVYVNLSNWSSLFCTGSGNNMFTVNICHQCDMLLFTLPRQQQQKNKKNNLFPEAPWSREDRKLPSSASLIVAKWTFLQRRHLAPTCNVKNSYKILVVKVLLLCMLCSLTNSVFLSCRRYSFCWKESVEFP